MKMFKSISKICVGLFLTGAVAIGGSSAASALNFQWTITNSFGSTLALDTASCSPSGSISAPFTISSGNTVTFGGTSTSTSAICNVRYQDSASHVYGCQFQVQTDGTNGFISTNAYKGAHGGPTCTVVGNPNGTPIAGGWSGAFKMAQ
jgi:hypothetical protein